MDLGGPEKEKGTDDEGQAIHERADYLRAQAMTSVEPEAREYMLSEFSGRQASRKDLQIIHRSVEDRWIAVIAEAEDPI